MGLSTYSELLNTLLERQPDQWITVLENIEPKLSTHGFTSLIDFVTSDVGKGGLGMDKKQLVHLLRYNPVYKHKADHLEGKMGLCEYAKGVGVLGEHGVRHYETENVISKQGNSSDYRIAKLKRDHPVVADRLMSGEFKSVSEAERAAGIARPLKTDLEKVITSYEKLSDEDKRYFKELI